MTFAPASVPSAMRTEVATPAASNVTSSCPTPQHVPQSDACGVSPGGQTPASPPGAASPMMTIASLGGGPKARRLRGHRRQGRRKNGYVNFCRSSWNGEKCASFPASTAHIPVGVPANAGPTCTD